MAAPLISARGLGVRTPRRSILHGVDFDLADGEAVTVVGPNGGGKTTLLRLLLGAVKPSEGGVTRRADLRVGYMPQRLAIDRTMPLTVDRFLGLSGDRRIGDRAAVLERVGLAEHRQVQMTDLSGGEFQRALLARALLRRPNLLVLDEPTQALDHQGETAFYRLIADLRAELGVAVLLVSHDLHVVMGASDRVLCVNGHVCCEGAPDAVSEHPEYRRLFGDSAGAYALYRHEHDHAH